MKTNKKVSYTNTLIYTIINAMLSLMILVVIFLKPEYNKYIYFIIVLEVGMIAIIAYCVYRMMRYEYIMKALRSNRKVFIPFSECADYYVKKYDPSGEPYCSNEYRVKGQDNNEYMMKVYPNGTPIPSVHDKTTSIDNSQKYEKFWLNEISKAANLPTNRDKCNVLETEPTDPSLSKFIGYTSIPWTHVKARCGGI